MTPSGTLPQVVSLLRGHVSRKYFHISSREWATIIKLEKLIILIKRRSRGFPEQVFSLLSNWVISRNSFLYDNQSQIAATTIAEEFLNCIEPLVIKSTLHQHFFIIYLNLLNYNGPGIAAS